MELKLKKFEGRNSRQESRITITKSNSFGFPQKFYKDNEINRFQYVVLYFDDENKVVGVHFMNDEAEKNKFKIIHSKKGYGAILVARSFFIAHKIDTKIYCGRYEWKKHNLEGVGEVFVFQLKNNFEDKNNEASQAPNK